MIDFLDYFSVDSYRDLFCLVPAKIRKRGRVCVWLCGRFGIEVSRFFFFFENTSIVDDEVWHTVQSTLELKARILTTAFS